MSVLPFKEILGAAQAPDDAGRRIWINADADNDRYRRGEVNMPHTPTIVSEEDRARLRTGLDTQATQTAEPGEEYLHAAPDAEEAGEAPEIGGAIVRWGGLSSVHQALIRWTAPP